MELFLIYSDYLFARKNIDQHALTARQLPT